MPSVGCERAARSPPLVRPLTALLRRKFYSHGDQRRSSIPLARELHVLASCLPSARPVAVQIVAPDLGSWQAPRMPSDAGARRLRTCHTSSC